MNRTRLILILQIIVTAWLLVGCNATKLVPDNKHLLKKNIVNIDTKEINTTPITNYIKQPVNTKTAWLFNFLSY